MAQCRRCCSWWRRYCCCCCCCCCKCCDDDDSADPTTTVHTPLLAKKEAPLQSPKEGGFSELQVKEDGSGEETQLMEVMVVADQDAESEESPQLPQKTATSSEVKSEVSPPPQSEPSTFVRGSGSRSSWRVVPTITSQAKEAAAAAAAQSTAPSSSSPSEKDPREENGERQARAEEGYERNVVLLPHEVEDDEATLEEASVTVTFSFNDPKLDQTDSTNNEKQD